MAGRSVGDPKEPLPRYARLLDVTTGTWSDRELRPHQAIRPHQAKLRRRRDCARQRWPFGQHKITACLVAWTAMPESLRLFRWWSRPMVSCRDEVSALTTTVAAQSVPRDANALWPGSGRGSALATWCIFSLPLCSLHHQQIVESRSSVDKLRKSILKWLVTVPVTSGGVRVGDNPLDSKAK